MQVCVSPARRDGSRTVIFDQSLDPQDIHTCVDGEISISFCAGGMYDNRSKYTYSVKLTPAELLALVERLKSPV